MFYITAHSTHFIYGIMALEKIINAFGIVSMYNMKSKGLIEMYIRVHNYNKKWLKVNKYLLLIVLQGKQFSWEKP